MRPYNEPFHLWLERVYRYLAEGDRDEAMTEIYDRYSGEGLRPPKDEIRVARSIKRGRAKEPLHA